MAAAREDLPENVDALKAALLAERARAARVEAELAVATAKASEADAPALRPALGTHGAAARPDGTGVGGTREFGHRGRSCRRERRGPDHECGGLHPQAPGAPALPRPSAARAGGRAGPDHLPVLRQRAAAQDGRGHDRVA